MSKATLPWPPKELSPNARKDRRQISGIRSNYRIACRALAKAGLGSFSHLKCAHLRITFHPPDAQKRDLDNMLASIKSGLDGVSDAIGVDDGAWGLTILKGDPVRPSGAVVVEVVSTREQLPLRGIVT